MRTATRSLSSVYTSAPHSCRARTCGLLLVIELAGTRTCGGSPGFRVERAQVLLRMCLRASVLSVVRWAGMPWASLVAGDSRCAVLRPQLRAEFASEMHVLDGKRVRAFNQAAAACCTSTLCQWPSGIL